MFVYNMNTRKYRKKSRKVKRNSKKKGGGKFLTRDGNNIIITNTGAISNGTYILNKDDEFKEKDNNNIIRKASINGKIY